MLKKIFSRTAANFLTLLIVLFIFMMLIFAGASWKFNIGLMTPVGTVYTRQPYLIRGNIIYNVVTKTPGGLFWEKASTDYPWFGLVTVSKEDQIVLTQFRLPSLNDFLVKSAAGYCSVTDLSGGSARIAQRMLDEIVRGDKTCTDIKTFSIFKMLINGPVKQAVYDLCTRGLLGNLPSHDSFWYWFYMYDITGAPSVQGNYAVLLISSPPDGLQVQALNPGDFIFNRSLQIQYLGPAQNNCMVLTRINGDQFAGCGYVTAVQFTDNPGELIIQGMPDPAVKVKPLALYRP